MIFNGKCFLKAKLKRIQNRKSLKNRFIQKHLEYSPKYVLPFVIIYKEKKKLLCTEVSFFVC